MTDLELFEETCAGVYQNTRDKVSWKYAGQRVHFQGSLEPQDWGRNFSVLPVPYRIRGVWIWVSLGMLWAWLRIRKQVLTYGPQEGAAYSGGAPVLGLWSMETGLPGVAFGCPNFLYRPSAKALALLEGVRFVDAPFDIVTILPPWGSRGHRVYELGKRHVEKPDACPPMLWMTGHSQDEYRQRLA